MKLKLEDKGYKLKRVAFDYKTYSKKYNGYEVTVLVVDNVIIGKRVVVKSISNQEQLDNVQIALNNLERDLK